MDVKEFLSQGYKINEKIKNLMLQLSSTRGQMPSPTYGGVVTNKGEKSSPTERNGLKALEIEKKIEKEIERLENIRISIYDAILSVTDADEQLVLMYRYLEATDKGQPLTWEIIGGKMGYTPHHVQKIHKKALAHLGANPILSHLEPVF